MVKTIFVSSLPSEVDEEQIGELFIRYGVVDAINLITHHKTGQSKGICFVEMNPDEAKAAIRALDGRAFNGRELYVRFMKEEDGKNTVEIEYMFNKEH